jgi:hypothetical protein
VSHGAYQDNCGDSETVGIDCAPAPPPPPPAQGTFSKSGDCFLTQSNTCVHSANHMSGSSYGNSESCTITVHGGGTLHDTGNPSFSTESCCDHLTVHGNRYDGSSGPNGVHVSDGDQISWRTDGSVTHTGWEFCLTSGSSSGSSCTSQTCPVGTQVRVILGTDPSTGWGSVSAGDCGRVTAVSGSSMTVDFPAQSRWSALTREMQPC